MKKEKDTEAVSIKHTQCETWSLWSVQMFKFQILSPLLFLCCKVERSYSSPLQFVTECEIQEGSRSCLFSSALYMQRSAVPGTGETLSQYLCKEDKRNTKKSQWSGDWDERWEWGKENRTNKSEIMLLKSHNVISEEI